jgi:hypothetical protein
LMEVGLCQCGHWSEQYFRRGFSLCAWFKTTGTEEDIIGNGVSSNGNFLFMTYNGKLRGHIWYGGNANVIDSNAVVKMGIGILVANCQ